MTDYKLRNSCSNLASDKSAAFNAMRKSNDY